MSVFSAATDGMLAYIIKPILDKVFIGKDRDLLKIMPFLLVALYLVKSGLRFSLNYTLRYMGQRVVQTIRDQLYSKLIYSPIRYYSETPTGAIISRITNDVNAMNSAIPVTVSIVRDVLSILGLLIVIFYMNTKMAILAIIIYPLFFHPFVLLSKRIRRYSRRGQEEMAEMTSILQESFTGVRVVKSFAQEESEIKRFGESNEKQVTYALKAGIAAEVTSPMMEFVGSIGIGAIVFLGGSQVINGEITAGAFFAFLAAVTMIYEPVKRLGNANATIQGALAAAERIFSVLDMDNEILDNNGEIICNITDGRVEFKDVSFAYPDDPNTDVLKCINLDIAPGLKVAFVGHSGAGKSTIANLLPRFYDITKGQILIDGVDLREFDVHSLRTNIGYVTQDPFLFNKSIKENIAYSSKEYSDEQIVSAAKAAFAHEFILELPNGYETIAGERGVRLSGGQKQRLTIARALLENPPLLILDEATSSLDTESEREVQRALDNLMEGRTSLVIAHRLSTIINADLIVVLEKGSIISKGKHDELLKSSEVYRSLYNMQAQVR